MVLEISMYFENTPIGILVPFPYLIFFSHHTLLFFASIYRGECAEQNALGLRRRSLMVLEISMYFENTLSEFWYHSLSHFPFTSHFAIFSLYLQEVNALNKMR